MPVLDRICQWYVVRVPVYWMMSLISMPSRVSPLDPLYMGLSASMVLSSVSLSRMVMWELVVWNVVLVVSLYDMVLGSMVRCRDSSYSSRVSSVVVMVIGVVDLVCPAFIVMLVLEVV